MGRHLSSTQNNGLAPLSPRQGKELGQAREALASPVKFNGAARKSGIRINNFQALAGISVGYSVVLIHQGYRFNLWSGHILESTNECINKWTDKLVLFLSLFLSQKINKNDQ